MSSLAAQQPKVQVSLGAQYNLELAAGYPAQAVYDAGCSFAECVDQLAACEELKTLLQQTTR